MLPRKQSIFHLGEEGGAGASAVHHHRVSVVAASSSSMAMGGRRARERERERLVVGLQILVHHHQHHHHGRHGHAHAHAANVVLKQMVRPRAVAAAAGSRHGHGHGGHAFSCSFLKACFLCKRELRHDKDVYMYRGDQGFCSEECRWQQILVDEAREQEAAAAMSKQAELQRRRHGQARHHSPHPTPIRGRPPPRKTLVVA